MNPVLILKLLGGVYQLLEFVYQLLIIGNAHSTILFFFVQYVAPTVLPLAYEGLTQPPTYRDAVINAFVYVHQTLHQANSRVAKRGGRTMAITPRHYLDFINHYVCLCLRNYIYRKYCVVALMFSCYIVYKESINSNVVIVDCFEFEVYLFTLYQKVCCFVYISINDQNFFIFIFFFKIFNSSR